ncbi:MAG: PAS domain-containing protein, partial [Acidobacteria bacterium]|nr:PAS domain-containing protein [Acidobacteriota bacterium]
MIHSLEDALFILDREGEVTLANAAAESLLPRLRQARGPGCSQCGNQLRRAGCHQRSGSYLECLADFDRLLEPCEVVLADRDFELRCSPLKDGQGDESERVFLLRDVTQKKQQLARQAHQERLSVIGEAAAVIVHELNNPLSAISMFSQMLLDELDAGSQGRGYAEVLVRNIRSCRQTLQALLELSTASSAEPGLFHVGDLASGVVELLRPMAAKDRTTLRWESELEGGLVYAAELPLRQALVNLVMNALQAAASRPGGEVVVRVLERGTEAVIQVRNNGAGIPPELRQRIFEPFFT